MNSNKYITDIITKKRVKAQDIRKYVEGDDKRGVE